MNDELLASLPPDVRQELMDQMQSRSFSRREYLWSDGDPADLVCFVSRGWVKLLMPDSSGRKVAIQLSGPGTMLCSSAVGGEGTFCCSAVAAQADTRILMIPREKLVELMARNPGILRALLDALGCRARQGCGRVVDVGSMNVEQRVARVLVRLGEQAGLAELDGSTRVPLSLTPQDLADLCATTVEDATAVLARLEETKAVTSDADGMIVRDMEALSLIADD